LAFTFAAFCSFISAIAAELIPLSSSSSAKGALVLSVSSSSLMEGLGFFGGSLTPSLSFLHTVPLPANP